jgi:hypothetical protein
MAPRVSRAVPHGRLALRGWIIVSSAQDYGAFVGGVSSGRSSRGPLSREEPSARNGYGAIDFTLFITMLSKKTPQLWPALRSAQVPTLSWV